MPHPLGDLIEDAFHNVFPPADGRVTVVPARQENLQTVMAFTGHAVVATQRPPNAVLAKGPDGFGGALAPDFLLWLADEDGRIGTIDVVLVAAGRGKTTLPVRPDLESHPRVQHAVSIRNDVVVYGDDRGVATVGSGIGGLTEISVEVAVGKGNAGVGRSLITDALGVVEKDRVVVAEVAPGNAQSLRAFLTCGFKPIGSAVHIQAGNRKA